MSEEKGVGWAWRKDTAFSRWDEKHCRPRVSCTDYSSFFEITFRIDISSRLCDISDTCKKYIISSRGCQGQEQTNAGFFESFLTVRFSDWPPAAPGKKEERWWAKLMKIWYIASIGKNGASRALMGKERSSWACIRAYYRGRIGTWCFTTAKGIIQSIPWRGS